MFYLKYIIISNVYFSPKSFLKSSFDFETVDVFELSFLLLLLLLEVSGFDFLLEILSFVEGRLWKELLIILRGSIGLICFAFFCCCNCFCFCALLYK